MRVSYILGFAGLVAAAKKPKSFLKELGNSTWVLGNEIWNVTQNRQYANQLWYAGKDRVGAAVGHYVSYSTCRYGVKLRSRRSDDAQMAQRLISTGRLLQSRVRAQIGSTSSSPPKKVTSTG
jgi:hypothetical protein